MKKIIKDKQIDDLIKEVEDLIEEQEVEKVYDNVSQVNCDSCGARLTVDEWQDNESVCTDCLWEQTSGIVTDNPEDELG